MTDRFQPIRDELRRYPELPRFTLSRGTVTDLVEALATTEAALAEAERKEQLWRAEWQQITDTAERLQAALAESRGEVERLTKCAVKIREDRDAAEAVVKAAENMHLRTALAPSHSALRTAWQRLDAALAAYNKQRDTPSEAPHEST